MRILDHEKKACERIVGDETIIVISTAPIPNPRCPSRWCEASKDIPISVQNHCQCIRSIVAQAVEVVSAKAITAAAPEFSEIV
jgi:hypothetical protein